MKIDYLYLDFTWCHLKPRSGSRVIVLHPVFSRQGHSPLFFPSSSDSRGEEAQLKDRAQNVVSRLEALPCTKGCPEAAAFWQDLIRRVRRSVSVISSVAPGVPLISGSRWARSGQMRGRSASGALPCSWGAHAPFLSWQTLLEPSGLAGVVVGVPSSDLARSIAENEARRTEEQVMMAGDGWMAFLPG
jgi:hypothetical protein